MTTMQTRPFPLPADPVGSAEAMGALPTGSIVRQQVTYGRNSDSDEFWIKAEIGGWLGTETTYPDRVPAEGDSDSDDFDFNDGFVVEHIPNLQPGDLDNLPTGSVVYVGDGGASYCNRLWTKNDEGSWISPGDIRRNSLIAMTHPTHLVRSGPGGEPVAQPEEPTEEEARPVISNNALAAGMYLVPDGGGIYPRIFLIERIGGTEVWRAIVFPGDGPEYQVRERAMAAYDQYQLLPYDDHLRNALAQVVTSGNREAIDQARSAARQEGALEERRIWEQRMERFNTDLHEWASHESLDGDFDDLLERHSEIGLRPRTREYEVTYTITVRHRRTVTAASADEALTDADDSTGFSVGLQTTLYSEDVEITDIDKEVDEL